jgi:hypothetical protein
LALRRDSEDGRHYVQLEVLGDLARYMRPQPIIAFWSVSASEEDNRMDGVYRGSRRFSNGRSTTL